jgi:hypothetical protein
MDVNILVLLAFCRKGHACSHIRWLMIMVVVMMKMMMIIIIIIVIE